MNTPSHTQRAVIAGGGLAGLAAAVALHSAGFEVEVCERRPFLGGRASSYEVPGTEETVDNCQHVLLGCCTNLLDFYERLGVRGKIKFHDVIRFVTPGGRTSAMRAGLLPAPLHLAGGFLSFHALGWRDKAAIALGMAAVAFDFRAAHRARLDAETMMSWLQRHHQTPRAIEHFWRVVLTSALNEDLERVAAWPGLQVFWKGFLVSRAAYRVGTPAVPLGDLYRLNLSGMRVRLRTPVRSLDVDEDRVAAVCAGEGERIEGDWFVVALPFEHAQEFIPGDYSAFTHSPIVGIHLWFDRPVLKEPFAALLGRTIQWAFRKPEDENYVQCVVSAARSLVAAQRNDIIEMAVRELEEFFPGHGARLLKAVVVKEVRATYSAAPGVESARPAPATRFRNCFLAGDWVDNGWPPTMEAAVRSGYLAAELIAERAGMPHPFLKPELTPEGLSRWAPAARSRS